jgi:hypothetical protein
MTFGAADTITRLSGVMHALLPACSCLRMNMAQRTEIIGGGNFDNLAKPGKDNHPGQKANKKQ